MYWLIDDLLITFPFNNDIKLEKAYFHKSMGIKLNQSHCSKRGEKNENKKNYYSGVPTNLVSSNWVITHFALRKKILGSQFHFIMYFSRKEELY